MSWKVYNYSGNRIGDKVGASYLISYQVQELGDKFILIDPSWDSHTSFPIKQFFPQISNFVIETKNSDEVMHQLLEGSNKVNELVKDDEVKKQLQEGMFEQFHVGNIWITAPSLKLDTGYLPTMFIPKHVKRFAETITIASDDGKHQKRLVDFDVKIINHCLLDPQYNAGRQHNPEQWVNFMKKIRDYMEEKNIDGAVVDVPQYDWAFQPVIGMISTADIFIGGDTGTTHVAGALGKNIVAIYGNSDHDVKAFHEQKEREGRSSEWCSDPISNNYKKFVMTDHKFNEEEVFEHVKVQIDKHLEGKVVIK